jgi:hypothetical protein
MVLIRVDSRERIIFSFFLAVLFPFIGFAQIQTGGLPPSLRIDIPDLKQDEKSHMVPAVSVEKAVEQDEEIMFERRAVPADFQMDLLKDGVWTRLPNGDRLCTANISAVNGYGLLLTYSSFVIPEGAEFYVHDGSKQQIKGAYTSLNNKRSGRFMTGFIIGQEMVLEYYEPQNIKGRASIVIDKAFVAHKPLESGQRGFGFGMSEDCHTNINCSQAGTYRDESRGVVRIMMVLEEGIGLCSGTLINTESRNERPYILTAYHCQDGFTPIYSDWRFDFNFQSTSCTDPSSEPAFQSIVGCEFRAGRQESDFLLIEANAAIPPGFNAYFNGWSRSDSDIPRSGALIHHPVGDIKKFSMDFNNAIKHSTPINWDNGITTPALHHWEYKLDLGSFELGSSGAPLFNESGLIIGQLHGGFADCDDSSVTFGGMFSKSWDEGIFVTTRLREWLDPDMSGVEIVPGYQAPVEITLSGRIFDPQGMPVTGAVVLLDGSTTEVTTTNAAGYYEFPGLEAGFNYYIQVEKDVLPTNGVTTSDISTLRRHLLSFQAITNQYLLKASDVNADNKVSTLDILNIRQLILNNIQVFPNGVKSWGFESIADQQMIQAEPDGSISIIVAPFDIQNIDFIGYKIGDTNGTADPTK